MILVNVSWGSDSILEQKSSLLCFLFLPVKLICTAMLYYTHQTYQYDILWTVWLPFCVIKPTMWKPQCPSLNQNRLGFQDRVWFYWEKDRMMAGKVKPVLKICITTVLKEEFRSFTWVKVATPQCKNTPSQVGKLRWSSYTLYNVGLFNLKHYMPFYHIVCSNHVFCMWNIKL